MPRARAREIGDLALDPHRRERLFEDRAGVEVEARNGVDVVREGVRGTGRARSGHAVMLPRFAMNGKPARAPAPGSRTTVAIPPSPRIRSPCPIRRLIGSTEPSSRCGWLRWRLHGPFRQGEGCRPIASANLRRGRIPGGAWASVPGFGIVSFYRHAIEAYTARLPHHRTAPGVPLDARGAAGAHVRRRPPGSRLLRGASPRHRSLLAAYPRESHSTSPSCPRPWTR